MRTPFQISPYITSDHSKEKQGDFSSQQAQLLIFPFDIYTCFHGGEWQRQFKAGV